MRWWQTQRTNLALCVVALGLVAVTVWDRGHISTDEAKDRQHQLLAAWRVDDIGRIDIRYRDRDLRLEAARDEDGMRSWTLREGEQNRDVDEQAVHAYLQTLEYAAPVRMVSETARAKLGLTEPRLTITVHMASLRYTLRVGGEAPSPAGGAYVEVEDKRGRKRYVIDAQLWSDLSDGLAQLRSKRLVSYLSTEVGRFEMVGPAANWTLERGGWGGRTAGAFMLKRPQHADVRVSRRALDGWLTELGSSDVEHFVPLPDKAVAGAQQLTLVPLDKARAVAQLSLGGECPGGGALLWRRKPLPAAGCIDRALARRLIIRADALVDDYVLGSAEGDITELSLDELGGDSADIDVARKDQGWHMRKPHQGPVASEPMTRWLKQLIAAKGVPVTAAEGSDLAALGLAPARARLRIIALPERGVAQADQRVEQLDVGQPRDGFVYVKRHDDGALLKLAEDVG
ncbi:MAG TPA: DUF4340 domain-containing protein, partial [Sorangium sp.]|nr:DUF4340 domain-containing protein [Sorangium sp.]